jgi:membrane-bound inhibitor of C-type lysozyme
MLTAVFLPFALLLAGCTVTAGSTESVALRVVQFKCSNGEQIEMRFFPARGVGVLVRGGNAIELQQMPSASGFVYSNGPNTVRGKGNELTVEIGRMVPIQCVAA